MCDFSYNDISYDWLFVIHQWTSVTNYLRIKYKHVHQLIIWNYHQSHQKPSMSVLTIFKSLYSAIDNSWTKIPKRYWYVGLKWRNVGPKGSCSWIVTDRCQADTRPTFLSQSQWKLSFDTQRKLLLNRQSAIWLTKIFLAMMNGFSANWARSCLARNTAVFS